MRGMNSGSIVIFSNNKKIYRLLYREKFKASEYAQDAVSIMEEISRIKSKASVNIIIKHIKSTKIEL